MNNEMQVIVQEARLGETKTDEMMRAFGAMYQKARNIVKHSESIRVISADDVDEMQEARIARFELRDIRVDADKTRKRLKEQSTREGKAIQGVYNVIYALIKPEEERLKDQEEFAERIEEQKKLTIEAERNAELSKYTDNANLQSLHPNNLSTDNFNELLKTYKFAYEARVKAEKGAEKARKDKEEKEEKEQERIRKENVELKKQADKAEKVRLAEKKKQDALIVKERAMADAEKIKQNKIQDELRAEKKKLENIENKRLKQIEDDHKKAEEVVRKEKLAPDKEKLVILGKNINSIQMPSVKSDEAMTIVNEVESSIYSILQYMREKIKNL